MNWQFQYNEFVWLFVAIAILVGLFLYLLRWKGNTLNKIGDKKLVKLLIDNFSSKGFTVKFILLILAIATGIIAVMNPRVPGDTDGVERKGIDVAIALDVSKSMLAADLAPNRLERAKQFVNKLINEMPNDRIALILFAGKAYLQMPLTVDHGAASLFISSATPDAVPQQGTVISDALKMSAGVFNSAEKRFKTVVLISDGEDHDADAISTAKDLAAQGVMINAIGIGSPDGSSIVDPATGQNKRDEAGNTIISKLNEEGLKEIAQYTNGIYIRLQNSDDAIASIKSQLSQIERKAFGDVSQMNFKTYYIWFAVAMFILLLAENFIPERKKKLVV
ncbi:MAG TPA: VWA domain-containing protein [Chitinophagaceae bacterium]|nr:VWA domain-containing protein [Chitinophagaceae bacterium]